MGGMTNCPRAAAGRFSVGAPRVLVVEDNRDMRAYIASVLEERFMVLGASSGEEALALLKTEAVDVIVSDVMMQGMDGHEFLARMRSECGAFPIPLIFLTARPEPRKVAHSST